MLTEMMMLCASHGVLLRTCVRTYVQYIHTYIRFKVYTVFNS